MVIFARTPLVEAIPDESPQDTALRQITQDVMNRAEADREAWREYLAELNKQPRLKQTIAKNGNCILLMESATDPDTYFEFLCDIRSLRNNSTFFEEALPLPIRGSDVSAKTPLRIQISGCPVGMSQVLRKCHNRPAVGIVDGPTMASTVEWAIYYGALETMREVFDGCVEAMLEEGVLNNLVGMLAASWLLKDEARFNQLVDLMVWNWSDDLKTRGKQQSAYEKLPKEVFDEVQHRSVTLHDHILQLIILPIHRFREPQSRDITHILSWSVCHTCSQTSLDPLLICHGCGQHTHPTKCNFKARRNLYIEALEEKDLWLLTREEEIDRSPGEEIQALREVAVGLAERCEGEDNCPVVLVMEELFEQIDTLQQSNMGFSWRELGSYESSWDVMGDIMEE